MDSYSWAEIGGVYFAGAPDGDALFRGLMVSTIPGWRGLTGARGEGGSIPSAHGAYQGTQVLREERSFALNGVIVADSAGEAAVVLTELEAALGGAPVLMRVCDATGVWSRMVEVDVLEPQDAWNRSRVRFSIDLIAADPARYRDAVTAGPVGPPVRVGGLRLPKRFPWNFGLDVRQAAEVVNDGALPLYPVLRVTGSASSLVVYGGSRVVSFGSFSGELVFDCKQRRVFLNGVDVTIRMLRRDWPVVPAHRDMDFWFDSTAGVGLQLSVTYQVSEW